MTKISLITPTRNRPDDLKRLLDSLEETTCNYDDVEILFAIDSDDRTMLEQAEHIMAERVKLNIRFFIVTRSDHFSKDYYNYLSKAAQGRWILAINDDSIFMTQGWDEMICERMEEASVKVGDDILFGIIDDGMFVKGSEANQRTFSCWPLLSKEYSDLMGGILIEEIYTWGGDYWLGTLFAKVQGGRRKVHIKSVLVEHNSHHSNTKKPESEHLPQPESFALFQRIESEHPCAFNHTQLIVKLTKINEYLAKK